MFSCEKFDNGDRLLRADYSIDCNSASHQVTASPYPSFELAFCPSFELASCNSRRLPPPPELRDFRILRGCAVSHRGTAALPARTLATHFGDQRCTNAPEQDRDEQASIILLHGLPRRLLVLGAGESL
jgi:hypothetical protein